MAIKELNQEEKLPIEFLCDIAQVSRAAYYKWKKRKLSARETMNRDIISQMRALQEKVSGIYGYRRMTLNLNRTMNKPLNHKRIYRLMGIAKLQSVIRKKKKRYPRSSPQHTTENVLNRDFSASKPNEKWVTDVTELKYGHSKKAYLSAILDLYDGSIVSFVLGKSNNNPLVFQTLENALAAAPNTQPLIHSDRGFQYTSNQFKRMVEAAKMTQSMSRIGRCIDNGPMEAFWGTLKCEKHYLNAYDTFETLSRDVEELHKLLQPRSSPKTTKRPKPP